MDYLSDSSAENDTREIADLKRLQAAWKNVKDKRQSDKKSVTSVKNAIHVEQQKNLQARLAMTQKQLSKARQNTALLMKKLSEAEQQLELKQFENAKQKKLREEKQSQLEELRYQLEYKNKQNKHSNSKEDEHSRQQAEALRKRLELKQKQVDRLCLKIKSLELDKQSQTSQLKRLQQINESLKKHISESQNVINQTYMNQYSKGAHLLELSQAHKTIQRLVLLIRGTQEYRLLGQFAQEIRDIHFLSNIPRRMKGNLLSHKVPDRRKMCSCMEVKIDQRLLWTPQSCYKILLDMKIKYDSLTEDCIEEVLFQMNKIWLSREQAHVRRVKNYYEVQIGKLKKKSQIRYDQMVARKQIQRLKKELTGVKNTRKPAKGVSLQNLKNVGQYQDQVRIKDKQIRLLQQRIRLLQTESNTSDRVLYLEGALWIIEKVLKEMEINQQDMVQFEGSFREKIANNISAQDWIRSFKQFFEIITEINNSLVQRLITMRESTLIKISGSKEAPKNQ